MRRALLFRRTYWLAPGRLERIGSLRRCERWAWRQWQALEREQAALGPAMTGWPPSPLLQDDSRPLARWLASRVDTRRGVREGVETIREGKEKMGC